MGPDFIDEGSRIVGLLLGRDLLGCAELKALLTRGLFFLLLRFWNWRDQIRAASELQDAVCRLPVLELPVPSGLVIRRIEDWAAKEVRRHSVSR